MKSKTSRFALVMAFAAIAAQILILYVYEPVTNLKPSVLVQIIPAYFLIVPNVCVIPLPLASEVI